MKIVLIGPPGSGKGTQSELITKHYHIPHISMGDILRDYVKTGGAGDVKKIMEEGKLVPDELTVKLLMERLEKKDCLSGFILDGYPRNLNQVRLLKGRIKISHVIFLDVSEKTIIGRLSTRWQCPNCRAIYSKKSACHKCGSPLYHREDDKPASIKERMKVFNEMTKPLIAEYKKQGLLYRINGGRTPDEIFGEIKKILENK